MNFEYGYWITFASVMGAAAVRYFRNAALWNTAVMVLVALGTFCVLLGVFMFPYPVWVKVVVDFVVIVLAVSIAGAFANDLGSSKTNSDFTQKLDFFERYWWVIAMVGLAIESYEKLHGG